MQHSCRNSSASQQIRRVRIRSHSGNGRSVHLNMVYAKDQQLLNHIGRILLTLMQGILCKTRIRRWDTRDGAKGLPMASDGPAATSKAHPKEEAAKTRQESAREV